MPKAITPSLISILLLSAPIAVSKDDPSGVLLARFTVHAGASDRLDVPVAASLQGLETGPAGHDLQLYEVVDDDRAAVASQVERGFVTRLWWILGGPTPAGETRAFELRRVPTANAAPAEDRPAPSVDLEDDGEALTIALRRRPVLRYRYAPVPPPPGASPLYARGGFIHPLWSPDGEVLTRIQPPDHLHHFGIWNPWTRTEFEGRQIDFWNLGDGQGTVRFARFLSKIAGEVYGGFRSVHEHVDLNAPDPSGARVALNEEWEVRVWNASPEADVWLVDLVSSLSCATGSPLVIKAYRYQGFGFRATAAWDDRTATLLTSEGRDKSNGNATRARWCDVRGPSKGGTAGVLFMTYPGNFDYPERLRIWPIGTNEGRENVFFNFNPAQERDWTLEPRHVYTLRYRMLVYDGELSPSAAERCWRGFAHPPTVTRE
jgi:hypothetical protein